MGQKDNSPQGTPGLRERAEARLQSRAPRWNELPLEEMRALVYELQVHQIELEIQNDELRQGHIALAAANKKSSDFYDFAPMGFLTLDETGMIREINLTAAGQLAVTRDRIIGKPLVSFLAEGDIDRVRSCLRRVFQEPGPRHCEVKLKRPDGEIFLARLDSAASDVNGGRVCHTSITDLSDPRQTEQNIPEHEGRCAALMVHPPSGAMAVAEDITAKQQVQEALRESEAKFRASFDQAPIGAAIVSLDFRFQRVNHELCRLTGYSAAELTSRTFLDITHPEDKAESIKLGSLLARGEIKPFQMDKRYIRKDGEVVWVRLSVCLVKDAQGAPLYYLPTMEDVTASKQAEEALKESESRYRLLVNQIPAVVFKGYADWRVDFLDRKVEELTGYAKEDFDSGRVKWCDVIHEDDFDYTQRVFIEALKTDKSYVREHRIRRKDGTIRWVQCHGQIFCDAEGKIDHISGVSFDITRRQEAETIIRQERQRFFSLLDMLPAFVALLAPDRTLPFVNRQFRELFGDPEGRVCHELIFSQPEPCAGCKTLAVFETRQPAEYEWASPQGKIYEIHDYPFDDIDGSPMVLELGIDITERKALEAQLLQSQKMEAVGRLAGGVAHDFNNLLMAIMGYGELIRSSLMEDDPLYKYSDDILKATERAASLTQQLLAFSRQQVVRPQVLNLNRVAADLEKMLRRLIGEHIDLEIEADPALGPVKADPGQINQIIMNLAINARDAMPTGGRLILATANIDFTASHKCYSGVALPGRYVKLAVSDTGSGMDAGDPQSPLRAILHHERNRQRHRPGAPHGIRHCQTKPRVYRGRESARPGHHVQYLSAAPRGGGGGPWGWDISGGKAGGVRNHSGGGR